MRRLSTSVVLFVSIACGGAAQSSVSGSHSGGVDDATSDDVQSGLGESRNAELATVLLAAAPVSGVVVGDADGLPDDGLVEAALMRFDVRFEGEEDRAVWLRLGVLVSNGEAGLAQLEPITAGDPPTTQLSEVPLVAEAITEALSGLPDVTTMSPRPSELHEGARHAWVDRRPEAEALLEGLSPTSVARVEIGWWVDGRATHALLIPDGGALLLTTAQ